MAYSNPNYKSKSVQGEAIFNDQGEIVGFNPAPQRNQQKGGAGKSKPKSGQSQGQTPGGSKAGQDGQGGVGSKTKPYRVPGARNRLKSILKDNELGRESERHRSGKLMKRKLYKAELGDVKLFRRKTDLGKKDYNILLFVDVSGSMSAEAIAIYMGQLNDKEYRSSQTGCRLSPKEKSEANDIYQFYYGDADLNKLKKNHPDLAEFFGDSASGYRYSKTLKDVSIEQATVLCDMADIKEIRTAVYLFGSNGGRIKSFKDVYDPEKLAQDISRGESTYGGGTSIAPALYLANKDIENDPRVRVDNTLAVIVTDGETSPSGQNPEGRTVYMANEISKLSKQASLLNINLGIEENLVSQTVKNHVTVYKPSEFSTEIISAVKRLVHRSH